MCGVWIEGFGDFGEWYDLDGDGVFGDGYFVMGGGVVFGVVYVFVGFGDFVV